MMFFGSKRNWRKGLDKVSKDIRNFLDVGPGGINCACCFTGNRKTRRKLFRTARKLADKRAIKDSKDEN